MTGAHPPIVGAGLLLTTACEGDLKQRLNAGRVLLEVFAPGATIKRRVEKVHFRSTHEFERRVSVTIDSRAAAAKATELGMTSNMQLLALLPKGLMRDFDVRGPAGESIAMANRELDSRAAQSFLVALAERHVKASLPTIRVWDRLFMAAYRFPDQHQPPMNGGRALRAWAKKLGREDLKADQVEHLDDADLAWWDAAAANPNWSWWLRRLVINFAVFVQELPVERPQVFKYRWVDLNPRANLGPTKLRALGRERSGYGYQIPLHDFGRAASEHVHIVAPNQTFLTGGVLTRGGGRVEVRYRATLAQQSFYLGPRTRSREPGRCHVHLRVLPMPRALLSPMKLLAWYTGALMTGLVVLQAALDVADHISSGLDAVVALVFFAPSLIFPFLFHRDEHDLRWTLLKGWRDLVFILFAPVPLTFGLILAVPTKGDGRWVLTGLLTLLAVYTWLLVFRLVNDASQVQRAHASVLARESQPSKGLVVRKRSA